MVFYLPEYQADYFSVNTNSLYSTCSTQQSRSSYPNVKHIIKTVLSWNYLHVILLLALPLFARYVHLQYLQWIQVYYFLVKVLGS